VGTQHQRAAPLVLRCDAHRGTSPARSRMTTSGPPARWPGGDLQRLVPVPAPSPAAVIVLSEIRASGQRSQALRDAIRADRIAADDLPPVIADVWLWDDSPTSDLSEADWIQAFRTAGFFSYPPLLSRSPDGSQAPLERPSAPVTLYRGSTADRLRRMSWAWRPDLAELLGRRHTNYGAAALHSAIVAPDAVLGCLERHGEGWTIVVDPGGLTSIERIRDIQDQVPQGMHS
jgi:hypothetical protein